MLAQLAIVAFIVVVGERLTEKAVAPLFEKAKWDAFWLAYVAWLICSGLVALTQVNLFAEYIPSSVAGQVLTAVVAGGGSNFLHDLFSVVKSFKAA